MFDLSTPAAFISVLVFLPAVVALFIAIAPLNGEQAKVDLARRDGRSCS